MCVPKICTYLPLSGKSKCTSVGQYRQMSAMKYLFQVFRIGMSIIQIFETNKHKNCR